MSIKKTIFLSNKNDSNFKGMAIVTFEKKNQNTFGTIKTFNLDNKGSYVLGIKQNEKILKQNILLDNNKYNFILSGSPSLSDDIGCVLLAIENNTYTPIVWGSDKVSNYKSQIVSNLKNTINKIKQPENISRPENVVSKIENKIEELTPAAPPQSKHNISKVEMNNETDAITQSHLKNNNFHSVHASKIIDTHKQNFAKEHEEVITPYHNEVAIASSYATLFESDENEIENIIDKEINANPTNHAFYQMIAEQLDELFNKYPREKNLESLVDNSQWVKIKNDDNKYYVVGIIYNNNDIKYICYGVPGNYNKEPPNELREYSQWLPTNITNPYDNGYWVMYQDADTGENILVN